MTDRKPEPVTEDHALLIVAATLASGIAAGSPVWDPSPLRICQGSASPLAVLSIAATTG